MEWQIVLCVVAAVIVIVLAIVLPLTLIHRPVITPSTSVPSVPSAPNTPSLPSAPNTPSVPNTPSTPSTPSVPSAPNTPSVPSADVTGLITSLRATHGAPPLVYDPAIAAVSSAYAGVLLRKGGTLVHSQNPDYGENLASFRGYANDPVALASAAVRAWYGEGSRYDYDNPGFSPQTGHFTCLVWKSSTRYGIGIAYDPATTVAVVVMNTAPPGNLDTPAAFRANVLPPG